MDASMRAGSLMREKSHENAEPVSEEVEQLRNAVQILSYAVHGLAHDLREPIRTVGCYSELLGRSDAITSNPNFAEYIHLISGAASRMDNLVLRVLEYAQLLGGKQNGDGPVDMNLVVQTALANLQLKIDESGAAVVADDLPQVTGNPVQLTQLVQNIVSNSLNYRGPSPPQISIRCARLDGELVFSIEDNGIGIDPRFHQTIFTPFRRIHGKDFAGVGLGLAICARIVESRSGRIWVESAEGKGSIFHFTLPEGKA